MRWVGQEIQIVEQRIDPTTGEMALRVDYAGGRSDNTIAPAGAFDITATHARAVGRRGERRVIKTLRQRLQGAGHQVELQPGARDDHGEDAKIVVDGSEYDVQITMAPRDEKFWRDATQGSVSQRGNLTAAVTWLRASIMAKGAGRRPDAMRDLVLALDTNDTGALSAPHVIDAYITAHGDPAREFGFASVWVVGPTVPCCVRIGGGRP
jgi:hypothetical protein